MKYFSVKNFERFQHYTKRNPPWIRLYADLLNGDDPEYSRLTDTQKLHLIHLWLLASRHDNRIRLDLEWLQNRLSISEKINLEPLFGAGFIGICGDASNVLASCKQSAIPDQIRSDQIRSETDRTLTGSCAEPCETQDSTPQPIDRVYMVFPTKGRTKTWKLCSATLNSLHKGFGDVDLLAECRRALVWCEQNPKRQKTANGMPKFLYGWISRAVNKGDAIMRDKTRRTGKASHEARRMAADMAHIEKLRAEEEQERRAQDAKSRADGKIVSISELVNSASCAGGAN